ncbi:MAG: DUF190 domain-containing protein [Bryobacteraceae bacterium]
MNSQPGKLLRVYVNESDRYNGKPLYEAIVDRCRDLRIAGVTVFRAFEGFGETAEVHHHHLFRGNQPMVITIVERQERIEEMLPILEDMMSGGILAVTDVQVTVVSKGARTALP